MSDRLQSSCLAVVRSLAFFLLCWSALAWARDYPVGDLTVVDPVATPSRPGVKSGAVYFDAFENRGSQPDRLIGASSPLAARVELHEMRTVDNIMRMREIGAFEIPAGRRISVARGSAPGYHLMMTGMVRPVAVGERFDLTLTFERAGAVQVQVVVEEIAPDAGARHGNDSGGHGGHEGSRHPGPAQAHGHEGGHPARPRSGDR